MEVKPNEAFPLDAARVDQVGEAVEEYLSVFKAERRLALRVKLAVEDLLCLVLQNSGTPRSCRLLFQKRFGSGNIQIAYDGALFNPLTAERDEFTEILLKNLGLPCEWEYRNNENRLTIHVQRRRNSNTLPLLLAIAAAMLLGALSGF